MKIVAIAALAGLAAFSSQAEARSSAPAKAGTLTCNLDPGLGLVVGSVRKVDCAYDRYTRRGRLVRETYTGTMSRAGFDVGVTSGQTITWNVVTAGGRSRRGMMSGTFGGSSADATLFVGAGTQTMIAESGIMLAPVSQSGQVGLGMGFGITDLALTRG